MKTLRVFNIMLLVTFWLMIILCVIGTRVHAVVYNQATISCAWDAVTVPGLPTGYTIGYTYGYKLSPATVPTSMGTTTTTNATYTFTTYGVYAMCARADMKNTTGTITASSEWSCSDDPLVTQGGVTFTDSFWPVVPAVQNLRKMP